MNLSGAEKVILYVGLVSYGGIFTCIGIGLYLAYAKMDVMLDCLKNCTSVKDRVIFLNFGIWGKLCMVGRISGVLIYSRLYLKCGGVEMEDIENFPLGLKRLLIILHFASGVFLLMIFIMVGIVKFGFVVI